MSNIPRHSVRLLQLVGLGFSCLQLVLSGRKADVPALVYGRFRKLGGVYVKFLQLLVLRSESFRQLRGYDIYDVYDQVATEAIDIRSVLARELGQQAQLLSLQTEIPFAAGSFGQVYSAHYQGNHVILKVLRPTVVRDLKFDLKILGVFSRFISWFSSGSAVNARQLYKDFARTTLLETNYALEVDYASSLHERYRNHPNIFIPYTYREFSTDRIICQEYVDGIAATELIELAKRGMDPEEYVHRQLGSDLQAQLVALGSEILTSIFEHGGTYGDPHPGNIKFLSGNRVGLIDYGVQAPAPRDTLNFRRLIEQYHNIYSGHQDLRGYSQVLLNMYGGDIIRAAQALQEYFGRESGPSLTDQLIDSAEAIMSSQREQVDRLLHEHKMSTLFDTVVNKDNRFCLEYNIDGPEIVRVGSLFIALVNNLGVKNSVLEKSFAETLRRTQYISLSEQLPTLHPETAVEILASWFDQISYKNPQLHRKISLEGAKYV